MRQLPIAHGKQEIVMELGTAAQILSALIGALAIFYAWLKTKNLSSRMEGVVATKLDAVEKTLGELKHSDKDLAEMRIRVEHLEEFSRDQKEINKQIFEQLRDMNRTIDSKLTEMINVVRLHKG